MHILLHRALIADKLVFASLRSRGHHCSGGHANAAQHAL